MEVRGEPVETVVEEVLVGGRTLFVERPRDAEALLDEEAFAHEEYLPYWAELWPSAPALARALAARDLAGVRVAELGCGLGLPSVVAALGGARVLATDWSPDAVRFTRANAERNGAGLRATVCSWTDPGPLLAGAPWDLVVAADVLYEARNGEQLLALLPRLVDRDGEVLLADPSRPHAPAFLEAAAHGWAVAGEPDAEAPRVVLHTLRRR